MIKKWKKKYVGNISTVLWTLRRCSIVMRRYARKRETSNVRSSIAISQRDLDELYVDFNSFSFELVAQKGRAAGF